MANYKVAVSSMALGKGEKLASGDKRWSEHTASFRNMELDVLDLANMIYTGHSYTTWHKDNWRKGENYLQGQHLALDFDKEDDTARIATLEKDPFIKKYASLIYTTPTHKETAPRARVVFLLDTPIMQAKNYTMAATSLLWLYGSADASCKDPCRNFWGSRDCDMSFFTDNVLPLDKVKEIISQYLTSGERERTAQTQRIIGECRDFSGLVKTVASAKTGERNKLLFWAANRAREMWDQHLIDDKRPVETALIDAGMVAGLSQTEASWTVRRVLQ